MPEARKLQSWLTIRGPDGGTVVQDADEWLDLHDCEDLVIWAQVTDQSNVEDFTIETSPVAEEGTFLQAALLATGSTDAPRVTPIIFADASVPLARYLRWKVKGRTGSSFSLTFRIWVVASCTAGRSRLALLAPRPPEEDGVDTYDDWPVEGGDDALFDEETKRNLAILEEILGCDDAVMRMVRGELRREAKAMRRQASTQPPAALLEALGLTDGGCTCPLPSMPVSEDHER